MTNFFTRALLTANWLQSPVVQVLALACVALVAFLVFLVLFEPGLAYRGEVAEVS